MMLSCCIMIIEQTLENVFVLPHADGNAHPNSILKLYYHSKSLYVLCDCRMVLFLYLGSESQSKMLYIIEGVGVALT